MAARFQNRIPLFFFAEFANTFFFAKDFAKDFSMRPLRRINLVRKRFAKVFLFVKNGRLQIKECGTTAYVTYTSCHEWFCVSCSSKYQRHLEDLASPSGW